MTGPPSGAGSGASLMSAKVASALGALLVLVLLAIGSAIGVVDLDFTPGDEKTPRGTGQADNGDAAYLSEGERAPREFLYLDSARAVAYLSQLRGGNETLRTISDKTTLTAGGEIGVGGVKLTGEAAREGTVAHTVNATTASNFLALTATLRALGAITELPAPDSTAPDDITLRRSQVKVRRPDTFAPKDDRGNAEFEEAWKKVQEGDIVRFISSIRRPTFLRVYQALRQAPKSSKLGRQGAAVLKKIGQTPRLPLAVEVRLPPAAAAAANKPQPVLRLVMPIQSADLTLEPSLFAPRLTVVAKVVRRLNRHPENYRDLGFSSQFAPILELPDAALKRLNAPRARLQAELQRYRNITAPAAVVLPVALYK